MKEEHIMKKIEMQNRLDDYLQNLELEERCKATVTQYRRETCAFLAWTGDTEITKETVIRYKDKLKEEYKPATVNVKLAALNSFFTFLGELGLKVKQLKIQRQAYASQEKELTQAEYERLVKAARDQGNEKLALLIQTICATGIRVSELKFITAEAVESGEAHIRLKGKDRVILLPGKLRKLLRKYIKTQHIKSGSVFLSRTGKPLDRSNIWRMMKNLCGSAGVDPKKVFPHNLRHLFARKFYSIDHDIAKLADILGHSSIDTTRIYIITTSREHQKRLDRMSLVLME